MQRDGNYYLNVVRPATLARIVGGQPQFLHKESRQAGIEPRTIQEFGLTDDTAIIVATAVEEERRGMLEGETSEQLTLHLIARLLGPHTRQGGQTGQTQRVFLRQQSAATAGTETGEDKTEQWIMDNGQLIMDNWGESEIVGRNDPGKRARDDAGLEASLDCKTIETGTVGL